MSGFSLAVIAFFLALLAMSFSFAGGAVIVALPVSVLGIAAVGVLELNRRRKQARQVQQVRDEAKAEKVEFTPSDKETLYSD